jgi:hypothetical protein
LLRARYAEMLKAGSTSAKAVEQFRVEGHSKNVVENAIWPRKKSRTREETGEEAGYRGGWDDAIAKAVRTHRHERQSWEPDSSESIDKIADEILARAEKRRKIPEDFEVTPGTRGPKPRR